ncbi:MAG: helical backbone metal receptor [Saprospiraceae bacterium]|nr:helical backbone metal receptor [Saprospiraceae bacterium]
MARVLVDMMGREVTVPAQPRRIVSLVPSQTELLYALGLDEQVVGVTKFCVHPDHARKNAAIIGGTKNIQAERVMALNPDLIIGNKEENDRESIEQMASNAPVWMSDIHSLADALQMIQDIGALVGRDVRATEICEQIHTRFVQWEDRRPASLGTALYLIWANPWMGVASDTFINDMLDKAGFRNVLANYSRYPVLDDDLLGQLDPDIVLLSSEPFPFKEQHVDDMVLRFPQARILAADGELFSWYGSRLLQTPDYFYQLISEIRMN